jgi:hypothetical protein
MPLTKIQSLGITDGTIVNADINASAAIAGTKLTGVNDAKAWVNFNGTGTVAIRASFNVSSITDNGTGAYTANFTTAMPDVNYCIVSGLGLTNNGSQRGIYIGFDNQGGSLFPRSTTAIRMMIANTSDGSTQNDSENVNLAIFR